MTTRLDEEVLDATVGARRLMMARTEESRLRQARQEME